MHKKIKAVKLKRNLSLLEAIMIGLGPTIGPTIFVVPRLAVELAGPAAILTFILAGVITIFTALNYAEMSSRVPEAGGGYAFAQKVFGGFSAFLSGWFMWSGNVAYMALSAYTLALTISYFFPSFPTAEIAVLFIILITTINLVGVKEAGRTQVVLTTLVLVILVGFILLGLPNVETKLFSPFVPNGTFPIILAIGYVYTVFFGFEIITDVQEEVKRASVIVPKAILITMLIANIVFPSIVFVLIGVMPANEISSSNTPIEAVASVLFGQTGSIIIIFAAAVASIASLNSATIATSRIIYALSRDGYLPNIFVELHSRFRTPYFGILASSVTAIFLVISIKLEIMIYLASFGFMLGLLIINPAGLFIRRKVPQRRSILNLPLYPLIPTIAIITTIAMLPTIEPRAIMVGGIIVVIGVFIKIITGLLSPKH